VNPPDDGFGTPGDGTFNTPPLVEAADTGPFFHDNAVPTIEDAVAFYDGDAFNESPAGRLLASLDPEGASIEIDATQIAPIASFLRVVNSLENIRQGIQLLDVSVRAGSSRREDERLLARAVAETRDASLVLAAASLHFDAIAHLERAPHLAEQALASHFLGNRHARKAIGELEQARDLMLASP